MPYRRPRFSLLLAAGVFLLAVAIRAAGTDAGAVHQSPPAMAYSSLPDAGSPQDAGQADAGPQSPGPAAPAQYLGSDVCLACHVDQGLTGRVHGNAQHPRSPAAAQGCESCHGPGERHVEDPFADTAIRRFGAIPPREVNESCLSCHTGPAHALWDGSTHDARTLSCATCHSVHAPQSPVAELKTATEAATCAACHMVQVMKVKRVAHMPLTEGRMECSSCHNPHGAVNVRLLRTGNWINESCISCHAEKRGPFLFEHAAGRENCVSCHDPHGSSNDRMLVARMPMLCQRCHIGTRHPSTIYDNAAVRAGSNRIIGRSCLNCHQQIHGSNHPSGQSFAR